jgi:hypothetical protein
MTVTLPAWSLNRHPVFGEASIVKVEVEGQQGETTLTTRSEPYNGKAIHAESEIESANIRKLVGNTRGNIQSNKVRNAVSTSEAFRKMSCQPLRVPSCGTPRNFRQKLASRKNRLKIRGNACLD